MPPLKINLDEVFADQAHQIALLPPPGKRITCRACGLSLPAAQPGVLLCDPCAASPDNTRTHVLELERAAQSDWEAAHADFVAKLEQADAATLERWGTVQEKLVACNWLPGPQLGARLDATRALGDALSGILAAVDAMRTAERIVVDAARRRREALTELDALEGRPL